jgi:FkbH-like protein
VKILPEIIASTSSKSISDYFSLDRKIGLALGQNEVLVDKRVNVAVVASSTIQGIPEILRVQCAEMNILANVYVGQYNQYAQEILSPNSQLYLFDPDIVIVYLDTRAIAGSYFFLPYDTPENERRAWVEETVESFANLADSICKRLPGKVLLHNLEVPTYSPLGLMENKQEFGFIESVENVNKGLRERFRKSSQVFVFDYDSVCSRIGKEDIFDCKMYYLGDIKLRLQYMPVLCKEYARFVRALVSPPKKCIVLDLDNTLWGGIIGESELEGIGLGPTPEGRPFMEFQQCLLSLFKRGVILAINSKNNPDEALNMVQNHPHMVLKESHFAAIRINWDDKVANMKSIAAELNIGLDSLVFIDDDEVNREMVREFIPEVVVVDMPKDPALYVDTLMNLTCFDSLALTEEDGNKGLMYSQDKKRREVAKYATDLTEYLRMLEITVCLEEVNENVIPRISQLTQKTNQFNATTRRYGEEAILDFVESDKFRVISVHYSDKFGDNGLTGLAIVEIEESGRWRIDTFLLSCRIIGRGAEEALLAYLIKEAKKKGAKLLCGEFIPSKKNAPAKQFYEKNGFSKTRNVGSVEAWEYDLTRDCFFPDFISLKN